MKRAEISLNAKTEERIFSAMKFDDRRSERKKGGDQMRSFVRESRLSFIKYVMFDDYVWFRVSFGETLKKFYTRYSVQNSRSFLELVVQID